MGRSDVAVRRRWQDWVDNGRIQRHDGSGRHRSTTNWEDRLIVRSAVAASDSSLSTIRRVICIRVSTITLHSLWNLTRSHWNCTDCGRIVFSDESHFQLFPDNHRRRVWRHLGQRADPAFPTARQSGPQAEVMVWSAISFYSRATMGIIRDTLTSQWYVDDILRTVLLPFLLQYSGLICSKAMQDHTWYVLL
ncbi:HTH_Tnp_Tc3_2 domain-containing protein [Trichonephila clavipes]|nr:HTH_Tnp_Tc3_2 domain-containing protein [Trichonephila clavipes]